MKAVVPAAGLGTRFLPATKVVPKELLPLLDVPAVQVVVDEALAAGFDEVVLVVSPQKEAILRHFQPAPELCDELRARGRAELAERVAATSRPVTAVVQARPLGLGHAVGCARHAVGDEPFAVLLPDDLFLGDVPAIAQLAEAHRRSGASVLGLLEVTAAEVSRYGIVRAEAEAEGAPLRIRDLVEKPAPADAPSRLAIVGRYLLEPSVFERIERTPPGWGGEIQLTDALRGLAAEGGLVGVPLRSTRLDTGEPMGLLEAAILRALAHPAYGPRLREFLAALPRR
jgi:UTP--glucose-1-phosphate uridylyltransferase